MIGSGCMKRTKCSRTECTSACVCACAHVHVCNLCWCGCVCCAELVFWGLKACAAPCEGEKRDFFSSIKEERIKKENDVRQQKRKANRKTLNKGKESVRVTKNTQTTGDGGEVEKGWVTLTKTKERREKERLTTGRRNVKENPVSVKLGWIVRL